MTWAKIDDNLHGHPKAIAAGLEALGLWTLSLSWSSAYLTDGFIPDEQVPRLGGNADIAAKLITAGLWARFDGGYQIHDFLEYNPSAEEVKEQRATNAERQARWRGGQSKSNGVSNGGSNGDEDASTNSAPVPVPVPVPVPAPEKDSAAIAATPPEPPAKPPPKEPKPLTPAQEMFTAVAELCQIDLVLVTKKDRGILNTVSKRLRETEKTPAHLAQFARYWYAADWRGQKGQAPTPHDIPTNWGRAKEWLDNGGKANAERDERRPEPASTGETAKHRIEAEQTAHALRVLAERAAAGATV